MGGQRGDRMTNSSPTRAPRSDALRNRQLLLTAAAEAFAEHGTDASIVDIARRAGVGKGTVFRHFATKDDLLGALMIAMIDNLIAACERFLEVDDGTEALYQFMATAIELLARERAFCEVVGQPSLQQPAVRSGIEQLGRAVETLTDRARRQGGIRSEITGADIVLLLAGIQLTAAPLAAAHPRLWKRYLRLTFDGIRTRDSQPLPLPAPRLDVFD